MRLVVLSVLLLLSVAVGAQNRVELRWGEPTRHEMDESSALRRINCLDCSYSGDKAETPYYIGELKGAFDLQLEVLETEIIPTSALQNVEMAGWPQDFEMVQQRVRVRKQTETHYHLKAIRKTADGRVERLLAFRIISKPAAQEVVNNTAAFRVSSQNSVLQTGDWYRIGIVNDGMYRITPAFLNSIGINAANIDPRNIRIYGNGGGMLPEANGVFRYDDLVENPIQVVGEGDGRFDASDYVLFYAEGPHKWRYNTTSGNYNHQFNLYADTNYYFITVSLGAGKRVANQTPPAAAADFTSTSFDILQYHQRDEQNLIRSGRKWYGETFDLVSSRDFSFNMPNRLTNVPVFIRAEVAARNLGVPASFQLRSGGVLLNNINVASTSSYYLDTHMHEGRAEVNHLSNSNPLPITLSYARPNNFSQGWLDFLEVQARADLNLNGHGGQLIIRDKNSIASGRVTRFDLAGASTTEQVWEITQVESISRMALIGTGRGAAFDAATDSLRSFIAFSGANFPTPIPLGTVPNQNLHGIQRADMIIVSPTEFAGPANQLASLHQNMDGLTVVVVTPQQIYNEFSSGRQDITAIRSFAKMLYDRAPAGQEPRYLLLLGSSSFDYKYRIAGNANWVPTFQSPNSNNPIQSYCADSYFGLLDDNEGAFSVGSADRMDIAIGRMPAKSVQQAQDMVNKIVAYLDPNTHGDWKNQFMLVADDEDNNIHINDSEALAGMIGTVFPYGVVKKVYFDAYRQESRPGGTRYPNVNRDINARMNLGSFLVSYLGHGGINGWAEERVLTIPEIQAWNSGGKLPLMITATCEFTRYDNPTFTSAGEWVLLNPRGGAVALMTTTRVTFTNTNMALSTNILRDQLFRKVGGKFQTLGEIFMNAANPLLFEVNTRNFCLLGDPALTLAYPKEAAAVTHINNIEVSALPDTLRALAKVRISGDVRNAANNQTLSNFNGVLTPTVFDKPSEITTLANDLSSFPRAYTEFRNIIYRGRATIANGQWSFTFIVPRDIAYNFGVGRVNLYATNRTIDAAGDFRGFIVGGTDTNFVPDYTGPQLRLYMNDRSFVNGGITDQNPLFVAELTDSSGINTVGSGIGRDITLVRNNEVNSPIILNEFYEASLDDYTKGEIRYPFFKLAAGNYTLRMKAWDVHNNSAEGSLDFVVAENAKFAIANLLNYPNPFTTQTTFHFDHNRPNQPLEAILQVYTVSGKLVKTLKKTFVTSGFHASELEWDGLDDFGDRIGRGVYVYRLRLRAADGESVQDTQKLVILR